MTRRYDAFVLFAEMRTGSNYLEDSLNAFPDINCLGEVYNPTFLGHHNTFELHGYDMDRREQDPLGLLQAIIENADDALPGFRLFHDHDDRVVERILPDPRIAKIILTRNPLDSYVSRKIASATGQWRLTDMKHAKTAKVRFDAPEFAEMLNKLQAFQDHLRRGMQTSGQVPFLIRYEDINDPDVLNGMAAFLGSEHVVESTSKKLKKQNPSPLRDKVDNYDEMVAAIGDLDRFGLDTSPELEPDRAPQVPNFVAHPTRGLLFCPIKGAPENAVLDWMGKLDGVGRDKLIRKMSQKQLRQWMKDNQGFRSFSVLRHPVGRAYAVFNRFILPDDRPMYADPRKTLRQRYKVPIPNKAPGGDWSDNDQKAAFLGFIGFLKGNLAGQTSVRVDQAWATQTAILQGISQVMIPQHLIHEDQMKSFLPELARQVGVEDVPDVVGEAMPGAHPLKSVYDGKIEQQLIDIYRRDYIGFGFPRWNRQ
ncbi:sulfotransferase domain-containing protein [Hasllibacter sp. MH4015]|uniref:sulfotransferase domain-containing protein n=1 Tax=Hasllibacter sp. MH4015 TaxID=2854029 RepID=UPI001CD4513D|nr:sulfotransferase domain-containing protein [Hasllibacter sp. MH4015]